MRERPVNHGDLDACPIHTQCVLDRTIRDLWREHQFSRRRYRDLPHHPPTYVRYRQERALLLRLLEIRARGRGRRE